MKGVFWRRTWKPFKVLKTFRDEKMRQDRLKAYSKQKRFGMDKMYYERCLRDCILEKPNAAIRTCCKLLMNSLFGKMLERSTNYEYIDVSDCRFNEDGSVITPSQEVITPDNHQVIEIDGHTVVKIQSKSVNKFLSQGVFILAYSRVILHSYMDLLGRDNIVATETDSLYFPRELLDRIPINEDSPG